MALISISPRSSMATGYARGYQNIEGAASALDGARFAGGCAIGLLGRQEMTMPASIGESSLRRRGAFHDSNARCWRFTARFPARSLMDDWSGGFIAGFDWRMAHNAWPKRRRARPRMSAAIADFVERMLDDAQSRSPR